MSWIKEHIVEVILGVAGLVGASSIIALANDVTSIITDKPYAVMAVVFCGVVIGVLVCYLSGLKEYRIEKLKIEHQDAVEARRLEEKNAKHREAEIAEKQEWISEIIDGYKNLEFEFRIFIYAIYVKGYLDVTIMNYRDLDYMYQFVDTETLENGTRCTLAAGVKEVFDNHPEILHVVKEYCDKEADNTIL